MRSLSRVGTATLLVAAVAMLPRVASAAPAQDQDPGLQAFRTGRYDAAIEYFEREVAAGSAAAWQARTLVRALLEVGRLDEAVRTAAELSESDRFGAELANTLGEAHYVRGAIDAAEQAFSAAIAGDAEDTLAAELALGVLQFERGEIEAAMARFDRFIDIYNSGRELSAEDLVAVAEAVTYLGRDDPQLFHDAVRAFDQAIERDPGAVEPRLRLGELFLSKYDSTTARDLLGEVLQVNDSHPRALLAMAELLHFEGSAEAMALVRRSLEVNPELVAARAFLGRLLLLEEDRPGAVREAERGLETNPRSLEALSVLAAAHYLAGDDAAFRRARERAMEINPRHAGIYDVLAEAAVQNRLYADAAQFARQGIEVDDKSWSSYGLLGLNELRLGRVESGKVNLDRAFEGDPFNVWIKNTLDLVDTFVDYSLVGTENFELFVENDTAELFTLYAGPLADEAYARLSERYDYAPETPIRIEVYESHADFSVRTVGLAGLGALGVSFGPVIAIDSPVARRVGEFNWGSTLWHEIAHTVTLGATDHRVPRWLTEGLSVYEERLAREGWGDDVDPGFLIAHLRGALLPVSELTDGFVRPRYPAQIIHSYYQASLVVELVEREHGLEALRAMLEGYRRGLANEQVFREVLGTDIRDFDDAFVAHMQERFAGPLEALRVEAETEAPEPGERPGPQPVDPADLESRATSSDADFIGQLRWGAYLFREGRHDDAEPFLRRAQQLFPEYAGDDSPYVYLAAIYRERGETGRAIEWLRALTSRNEKHYEAHLELAELLAAAGSTAEAVDVLDRAMYMNPFQIPVHERLAELATEVGRWDLVVRERRAVVASDPVDRAAALYRLALAYVGADEPALARRTVVRALEIAPGFALAQDLLLDLVEGTGDAGVG